MIDAHQHYWRIGANDCTWPTPDLTAIYRDFLPEDFAEATRGLGIEGSVLVQSQESDADTDFLCALAGETESVKALVGWADFAAPDAPARIAVLAGRAKVRGLRPMLQGLAEEDWILRPELAPAIEAMIAADLRFDALVFTQHLPSIYQFAQRWPALRIVIDHGGKPPIASGQFETWAARIAGLARLPNVWCKLSGLLTEAAPEQDRAALDIYIARLVSAFGAERLIWGSDWPVLLLAGGYGEWLDMARRKTGFSAADLDLLCGGNARAFYGI